MPALALLALLYLLLAPGWPLPLLAGAAYLAMSLLCFAVYAADKSAARTGGPRVRERTLHLLALFGGWPGAVLAQRLLHHKSVKIPFRAVFWLTVLLNLAGLAALVGPAGGRWPWLTSLVA